MDAIDKKIMNNYLGLLEGLNSMMKLTIIDRLKKSVKSNVATESKRKAAFGAWNSAESAEELIENIKSSRNTNRQIEAF